MDDKEYLAKVDELKEALNELTRKMVDDLASEFDVTPENVRSMFWQWKVAGYDDKDAFLATKASLFSLLSGLDTIHEVEVQE
jgi:hypothetical protein